MNIHRRAASSCIRPPCRPAGLGAEAYAFVDWLAEAGQSWWQMLPLGPPDEHGSPYKASSAFAAWRGLLADPDAPVSAEEERALREREAFWIDDWAAFAGDGAVADQVRFDREWTALRAYAAERGVRLIGDVPIYVAPGSADHVAHPELFQPGAVSGAPPDAYSELGQLWANPLYDWGAMRRRRYRWWVERFRRTFALFDVARIDHFRGFVAYWAVPRTPTTRARGAGCAGPGRAPFDAAARELSVDGAALPFIAEDLGVITPPSSGLRDDLGLPGMVVLQFGYDPDDPAQPAQARPPRRAARRLHRHARPRHRARLVRGRGDAVPREHRRRPRRPRHRRRRRLLGAHPPGVRLARRPGDGPGTGRPRPRLGGTDERAGVRGPGRLAVAAPGGRADLRARRPAARGDRGRRTAARVSGAAPPRKAHHPVHGFMGSSSRRRARRARVRAPAAASGAGFDDPSVERDRPSSSARRPATNPQRQDTPNDPDYDSSEPDDEPTVPPTPPTTSLYEERFDLFGFPSALSRLSATYKEGPNAGKPQVSGFNAAGAWKLTRGRPDVEVAVLDTGIRWDSGGVRSKVALNEGELPTAECRQTRCTVDDFKAVLGKDAPTGQDVIKRFSDGVDDDGNGYVDDIAGWDFFDDDNDPDDASSYFAAANHGTGRMAEAAERTNDAEGSLGVCPKCEIVPLRIWDTFVSDQNSFAMGVVYAADNGVEVIVGADGGLYHSRFAEQATEYAYGKGVAQMYSGDDLNTANHNFPAAYDHTQLVEGVVTDTQGLGQELPADDEGPGHPQRIIDRAQARSPGSRTTLRCRPTSAARTPRSSAASRRSPCTGRPARRTPARPAARRRWSSRPRARRTSS
jgi:4-alpha-glucanotransferase